MKARYSITGRLTTWFFLSACVLLISASTLLYWSLVEVIHRQDEVVLNGRIQTLQAVLLRPEGAIAAAQRRIESEWSQISPQKIYVRLRTLDGKDVLTTPAMPEEILSEFLDKHPSTPMRSALPSGKTYIAVSKHLSLHDGSDLIADVAIDLSDASIVGISAAGLGVLSSTSALAVAQRAAFAYLLIGLLDYAWRRRQHEKQLRMTKQQVRDEVRQYGVSAEVKAALRRRQMQAARARMMAAVPDADVVVTNPTHYAVALMYDGTRTAPEVVAKGKDLIAQQIRRVAEENDVPVISDPPLARALHASVEIGQAIPEELYAAVARVLAFVYRLAGRSALARRRLAS